MSHCSRWSQHQVGFMFGECPRKPIILKAWFQLWNVEVDLWWFGQQYPGIHLVRCCNYSEWSNYCQWLRGHFRQPGAFLWSRCFHTMMQFSKMTVCPYTQPDLNIIELLWSVLDGVRSNFPSLSSLRQLEDVLHVERYSIPLETIQNLYKSIPRRIQMVLQANVGPTPY